MPRVHLLLIPLLVGLLVFTAFLLVASEKSAPGLREAGRSDRSDAALARRRPVSTSKRKEIELGDLTIGSDHEMPPGFEVLAAGRVRDADGAPFPGVWVRVLPEPGSNSHERQPRTLTTEDGSFVLLGDRRMHFSLSFEPPDEEHFPALLEEVDCGTRDLAPRLYRGAGLHGRLIPPEGMAASWFTLRVLEGKDGELGPGTIPAADGSFRIDGVRPVGASLVVSIVGSGEIVREIDGLEFESGRDLRDARLQMIDLRGRVAPMVVEVMDEEAEPVANARVIVVARQAFDDGIAFTLEHSDERGRIILPSTRGGLDLEIARRGYRLRKLSSVADDICVILERATEIRLQIRARGFALPPDHRMKLRLACQDRRRLGGDDLLAGRVPDLVESIDRVPAEIHVPLEVEGDHELSISIVSGEQEEEVGCIWLDLHSSEHEKTIRLDSLRHALDRAVTRLEARRRRLSR